LKKAIPIQKNKAFYSSLYDGHLIDEVDIMYEPNSYVEKKSKNEVGKTYEDKIASVNEGTLASFIKDWETFKSKCEHPPDANQPTLEVRSELGAKKLIALPVGKEYSPKSNFGRWIKNFKAPPQIGQEVRVIVDDDGFFQFLLLKK